MPAIHFIIDVKYYEEEQAYLRLRLRLEEKRFQSWGEHAGLMVLEGEDGRQKIEQSMVFGKQRPTVQRAMVVDLLDQIQRLFDDFRRYQENKSEFSSPKKVKQDATKEAGELDPKTKAWMDRAFRKLPAATQKGWERMKWAAWDAGEFEKLIKKFKSLNDSMGDLLDSKIQQQIANTTQDTYRIVVQMATSFGQLERFVKATEKFSNQNPELIRYQQLARFKAFHRYIDKEVDVDENTLKTFTGASKNIDEEKLLKSQDWIRLHGSNKLDTLERCPMHKSASKFERSMATYREDGTSPSKEVWIEWRSYKVSATRDEEPPQQEVIDSVQRLARLLNHKENPTEFRVPHCLGYFNNGANSRFGFIFEGPPAMASLPKTLLELILDTEAKKTKKPSMTDRMHLGKALTSSLLYLHTADWLHKSLRSDNVIFLKKGLNGYLDLRQPTLSGFNVARPIDNSNATTAAADDIDARMYRHPSSLDNTADNDPRKRYCKTFDIYSLGVVLIEIAMWRPIGELLVEWDKENFPLIHPNFNSYDESKKKKTAREDIWDKGYAAHRAPQQRKIRDKLLREATLTAVEAELGEVYREVVKCCLTGKMELELKEDDDESQAIVGAKLGEAYYKKVVTMLEEIKV